MRTLIVAIGLSIVSAVAPAEQGDGRPSLTGPYLGQAPPGRSPAVFAPGIVTSEHASVTIARDGTEIYWSADRIYVTTYRNGEWSKPEPLQFSHEDDHWRPSRKLGAPEGAVCPYVSPDGKYLFFLRFERLASGAYTKNVYWMDASGLGLDGAGREEAAP